MLQRLIIQPTRTILIALQSRKPRVTALRKMVTGALLIPLFATALILLRLRARLFGPLHVTADVPHVGRFNCALPDLIQMYLYFFSVWEPDLSACITRRLKPGDTFIDVGANIGYFTMLAARLVGEGGRVVAVDASPMMYAALTQALIDNHSPPQVRTVHAAASDQTGELTIYAGPPHNRGLTTSQHRRNLHAEATVPAQPLADLLTNEEIDTAKVIKIDVEGGEPAVLRGMASLFSRLPHNVVILVELSPAWWDDESITIGDVLQPLFDAGFVTYSIPNNYWPWRYLWPNDTRRPQRLRTLPTRRVKRIDLVLSRLDREAL